MALELKPFDAEAIRDTAAHNSAAFAMREFFLKTIIIENGLNESVSLQCQGSANDDFSHPFDVGSSFVVTASTDTFETCDSNFPRYRVVATCSTAPTTGTLTIFFIGQL